MGQRSAFASIFQGFLFVGWERGGMAMSSGLEVSLRPRFCQRAVRAVSSTAFGKWQCRLCTAESGYAGLTVWTRRSKTLSHSRVTSCAIRTYPCQRYSYCHSGSCPRRTNYDCKQVFVLPILYASVLYVSRIDTDVCLLRYPTTHYSYASYLGTREV